MDSPEILYRSDIIPQAMEVIALFKETGMPRPVDDEGRIAKMLEKADIIVTAWVGPRLIGLSRALTDFSWCCYLSDLAVSKDYQKGGVGRQLIAATKELAGEQSMLLLLSVPEAMNYYPKIGFEKQENSFLLSRTK
ncbi:GNAT family N-acetyltransferase [Flavitalea flava]